MAWQTASWKTREHSLERAQRTPRPPTLLNLTFAVQRDDGYRSDLWHVSVGGDGEVSVAVRAASTVETFRFRPSGLCCSQVAGARPGTRHRRTVSTWHRWPTPPAGEGRAARVLWVAFPTGFLSRAPASERREISWISAAPGSGATFVEAAFTRETGDRVASSYARHPGGRTICYAPLPSGEAFFIGGYHGEWNNLELLLPGSGRGNSLIFSTDDRFDTGRPIRFRFGRSPGDGAPAVLQELGGYAIPTMHPYWRAKRSAD